VKAQTLNDILAQRKKKVQHVNFPQPRRTRFPRSSLACAADFSVGGENVSRTRQPPAAFDVNQ